MTRRPLYATALGACLFAVPTQAQVLWAGNPGTPGHVATVAYPGILQDGGTATAGKVGSLGLYGLGGTPFCLTNSPTPGPFRGSYSQLCLGESLTAATLSLNSLGGAAHIPLNITVNGTTVLSAGDSAATLPGFTLPFSSLTGNIATSQMAGGTGASGATFFRGDGTWAAFSPSGGIAGPVSSTVGYVPSWNSTNGTTVANGYPVATTGANTLVETGSGGTIAASILPTPGASTLGGVKAINCAGQVLESINTDGSSTCFVPSALGNVAINAGTAVDAGLQISGSGSSSSLSDLGISIANTGTGGHSWYLDSTGTASNYQKGCLVFADQTSAFGPVADLCDTGATFPYGITTSGLISSSSIQTQGYATRAGISGAFGGNSFNINWTGGSPYLWIDNVNLGTINITASDRRLKTRIQPLADGLNRIMALRPVEFSWRNTNAFFKDDGKRHHSFIADELQNVIPTAVNGEPNAVDADGKPAYQSLNPSEILPDMVSAIQELKRQIGADQKEITRLKKAKRHG